MRQTRKAPIVLLAVLALALANAGILYAHWTDTLQVDGEVRTGELNAGWRNVSCTDVFAHNDFTVFPYGSTHNEFTYVLTSDTNAGTLFDLYQTDMDIGQTILDFEFGSTRLGITHNNVYPSYWEDCQLEFRNRGSIPLAVPYLVIEPVSGNFNLATDLFTDDGAVWLEWASETPPNLQIDPGDSATASLKFHLEQYSSEQDATYEYTITLCVHNWNEPTTVNDDVCDLWSPGDGKLVIPEPFGP